jgi:hypothetical protein
MDFDDVAWEKSDEMFDLWKKRLYSEGVSYEVAMLIQKHRRGIAEQIYDPVCGSFNVCLRLRFQDGGSAMIRFAVAGQVMFPEEKVRTEVAAMRFIADNTTVPVPLVLHVGMADESPGGLGPFFIMEYVEHDHGLDDALNIPNRSREERPLLDPNISEEKLEFLYGQMAEILLQLSRPSLPRIGSFSETGEFEWSITERPLTFNANELVQVGDVSFDRLPTQTFSTASSYYSALADMNLEHLTAQHNDAVESEDDCRRKYVARHLFRNLASEGRLDHFPEFENGPFKLFCEDLRPTNVLVTEADTVAGVIDLEFTFAAPAGFAFSPPWWLLLEHPNKWPWGMDDWEKEYVLRLETFLKVLKIKEQEAIDRGILQKDQILSDKMRKSWDTGAFWVDYAARKSWAFDHIYFNRLDKKFFGEVEGDWLANRLSLLTEEQRQGMEPFVHRKMAAKEDRKLVDGRFDTFI